MFSRGKRRKSVYTRYFVSYCCIALIPVVVIAAVLMILLQQSHTSSARDLYLRATVQAASHIDVQLKELQEAANVVFDEEERLSLSISNYLDQVEQSNSLSANAFLYFFGSTSLFSAQGEISYQTFEEEFYPGVDLNHSQFFTKLNSIKAFTVLPLYAQAKTEGNFSGYAAVLVPYYVRGGRQRGVFAFIIAQEEWYASVADYLGSNPDYLYLYTPTLERFSCVEWKEQEEERRVSMVRSATGAVISFALNGGKSDLIHYKTDLFGLHLVIGTALNRMYLDLYKLQTDMLRLFLLVLPCLIAAAIALAWYSYRPIRALLRTIAQPSDQAEDIQSGELDYIGRHLESMQSEMQELHEHIAAQKPVIRTHLLQSVLRGSFEEAQLKQFLTDEQLRGPAFVALAPLSSKLDTQLTLDEDAIDGAEVYGIGLEDESLCAFLFFLQEEEDMREEQCRMLSDLLLMAGEEEPTLSAGSVVRGVSSLSRSFLEAYIALNSGSGDSRLHIYQSIGVETSVDYNWGQSRQEEIYLQSLRSVDFKTAAEFLNALLEHLCTPFASLLNVSYMRYCLFSKALAICEPEVARSFQDESVSIEIFSDEAAFGQLMLRLTRQNCQALEVKRQTTLMQKHQRILAQMEENCFEPDFSLSRLSALTGYSPTFINRFLREETGLSYIQYVSKLRMERARHRLIHTDDKIKEIVLECGYVDITSFNRKFKEQEGMTPTEYRQKYRA